MIQVAGKSEGVAAALQAEVILLVEVFLVLSVQQLSSMLSVSEGRRAEAGAGDFAMLASRGRVAKGQRRQVLGKRSSSANEVELEQFLRTGEGCHDAFDELFEHCSSVEI